MDNYGVVQMWDHLLSIPGLVTYLVLIGFGMLLVRRLTLEIPKRFRSLNYMMYLFSVIAIITWGFIALGLDFYVKA